MDPETPSQPLIRDRTAGNVEANNGRSSRAYKVAGIVLLACVLIVGQAMIAYFLLSQRNDMKSLEEQNKNLQSELKKGRSAAAPIRMPVNTFPELMSVSMDTKCITLSPLTAPPTATACQLEAAVDKPAGPPGFRPACDELGFYRAEQCYMKHCWCVNTATGAVIPGSQSDGHATCSTALTTVCLPDIAVSALLVPDSMI
uniref:Thyroglobulin type-1 domain-containing protein n=1 Tax=Mola mola TaxID=94237 RepID=A0A3Q3WLG9_MOLML